MKNIWKNKKALSTVVTTLIILVVSVLLATVVTYYTINVTTNRMQSESLYLTKFHVWVNTTGPWAEAAIAIINTGGRDIVLDKVTVRGQTSPWTAVYYWQTNTVPISSDLTYTNSNLTGTYYTHTIQGSSRNLTRASSSLTLKSGYTMVLYITRPDSIAFNDIGTFCSITIFTANAPWSQDCMVEAVPQ